MAEIKDIYSLEFNSSQFTAELDAAIGRIEELNGAMEDGADASEALAAAENNLVSVLKTDAKTTEGLNQKRDALVKTQKTLNNESKTGVAVGKQVDATNKQLAVSTGQVATQQKSLGGQLLQGARSLNSLKRAAGLVTGAFRLLGAFNPIGMFLMVLPTVVGWFQKLTGTTDKGAEAMEKLKDNSLGYTERLGIIQDELERLEAVEARRGYLTDAEKENRQELTAMYQKTAEEIVKIETERYNDIRDLQIRSNRIAIKLRGESIQSIRDNFKNEVDALKLANEAKDLQIAADIAKLNADEKEATLAGKFDLAAAINKQFQLAAKQQLALWENQTKEIELLEKERNDAIVALVKKGNDEREKREAQTLKTIVDSAKQATKIIIDERKKITKAAKDAIDEQEAREEKARKSAEKYVADNNKIIEGIKDRINKQSAILQNNRETELALDLTALEEKRNAELLAAFGNAEAQKLIDEKYNKERVEIEKEASKEIINNRIKMMEALVVVAKKVGDTETESALKKQIAELKLQLVELDKAATDTSEKTADKWKEAVETAAQYIQLGSDAVFQVLNAQVAAYISNLDNAISRSKSTLDEIRANSENFNARQLELERDRLEKLEEERRKAVERERTIALVQLTVNSLLAISKAAAEGGAAAPFTIASTIIALIAGFAAARAAAGNAFYEGSEYVDRNNRYPNGRDTVPARLNKGERVIKTDTNQQYWDSLSAIHHGRIPADVINDFVNNYKKGGSPTMDSIFLSDFGVKPVIFNGSDNSALENRLGRIEIALLELPKYMPQTTVTANANGIFKIVERRQAGRNFSRNRAK